MKLIDSIISTLGFQSLNLMQESMLTCKAKNRMLLAPTGAGKTLAYLLPCVERFSAAQKGVEIIIISPSRELALQIDQVFRTMKTNEAITCVYGGHSQRVEKRSLEYTPRVVVGTPGRLLDHLDKGSIDGNFTTHLIFDEFDKLLEMGFDNEMGDIVSKLPNIEYCTLTSATPTLDYPDYIDLERFEKLDFLTGTTSGQLEIKKIHCTKEERKEKVVDILRLTGDEQVVIFCNFREQAQEVSDYLFDLDIESEFFHGGMEQHDRERALSIFKNKSSNILVSTDLAARGLDISSIKHVIHFELPNDINAFTHRNGRTARVAESGTAYVLITDQVLNKIDNGKAWKYDYVADIPGEFINLETSTKAIPLPRWITVYFGKGKKDKLSKIDIVGFLCQKGGLAKEDIGMIELKDFYAYAAINRSKSKETMERIKGLKIKNKTTKIYLEY